MRYVCVALLGLFAISTVSACDFQYDPVSTARYYRSEGWDLPGISDFDPHAPVSTYALPMPRQLIPGAGFRVLSHDDVPYIVELPAQQFLLSGTKQKMRAAQFKATIVRWSVNDRIVAYSYGFIPVTAHREKGKWVVDVEVGCIFDATFIDDKGDGVFRLLVPGTFSADLIPSWAAAKRD